MSTTGVIVAIISLLGALILAWSGLQSHNLSTSRKLKMAAIWAAIIGGLALLLSFAGV
jgi:hypothetical protein